MTNSPSVKQIIIDFIYLGKQLNVLFKDKNEYRSIIDFIQSKDFLDDELDIPFPKQKDIEEATGIKSHTLRKMLLKMHSEIFNSDSKIHLSFTKTYYEFYIKYFNQYCYFTVDNIPHLPRIGENISLPFVSATIPLQSFYVENISHEFKSDTQIITISLKVGDYNEYWRFVKDKAIELREIGFNELFDLDESQLKKIIYSKNPYR